MRIPAFRMLRSLLLQAGGAIALLVVATVASGCGTTRAFTWAEQLPPTQMGAADSSTQPIGVGDTLYVLVYGQDALSGRFDVGADGALNHPLAGRFVASGLTLQAAAQTLESRLQGKLVKPQVTVSIVARRVEVSVLGEVKQPGHYSATLGDGVLAALARAQGLTEFADADSIFVLRRQPTPMAIRFRMSQLTAVETRSSAFVLQDGDVIIVE